MKKLAILASGAGTNAEMLIKKSKTLESLEISLIITDKKDAGVIQIANKHNIPIFIKELRGLTRKEHEQALIETLKDHHIQWVLLAGYMRVLTSHFLDFFWDKDLSQARVINIHPSLLPKHKGLQAFEKAWEAGDKESGISIHFVNREIDAGDIILQMNFTREEQDHFSDFVAKGKKLEHALYPQVLEMVHNNQLPKGNHAL